MGGGGIFFFWQQGQPLKGLLSPKLDVLAYDQCERTQIKQDLKAKVLLGV